MNDILVRDDENREMIINQEIKSFFVDYPAFKPYILRNDDKNTKIKVNTKNIERSFFMLIVLVLFYYLNFSFIYNARDIQDNNYNVNFIYTLFDNTNVGKLLLNKDSYAKLKDYLINKIGKFLLKDSLPINITLPINAYYDQIANYINLMLPNNTESQKSSKIFVEMSNINFFLTSSIHIIMVNYLI